MLILFQEIVSQNVMVGILLKMLISVDKLKVLVFY